MPAKFLRGHGAKRWGGGSGGLRGAAVSWVVDLDAGVAWSLRGLEWCLAVSRNLSLFSAGTLFPRGMASPGGFEPPTFGLGNHCSIRLSYEDSRRGYSMGVLARARC